MKASCIALSTFFLLGAGCAVHSQSVNPDGTPAYHSKGLGAGDPKSVADASYVTNVGRAEARYVDANAKAVEDWSSQFRNNRAEIEQALIEESAKPPRDEERSRRLKEAMDKEIRKSPPDMERIAQFRAWLAEEDAKQDPERIKLLKQLLENAKAKEQTPAMSSGARPVTAPTNSGASPIPPAPPGLHNLGLFNTSDKHLRFVVESRSPGVSVRTSLWIPAGQYGYVVVPSGRYRLEAFDKDGYSNRTQPLADVNDIKGDATYKGIPFDAVWGRSVYFLP